MNRCRIPLAAFTLIEMMIAVALGMLIVYTAVSGFRTAAQTIASANRLSLENSLLRSGYFEAQIQLDFWTNHDDPTKPDSERPLKSDASIGPTGWPAEGRDRGLPFTPMKALQQRNVWQTAGTVPRVTSGVTLPGSGGAVGNFIEPRSQANVPVVGWELDRGWDPSFYWSPHDPRTWCRANLAEKDRPNGGVANDGANNFPPFINGRYAIFSNTSPVGQTLHSYTIKPDLNHPDLAQRMATQQVSYSGYPNMVNTNGSTSIPIYSWYPNQLDSLIHAMGYAAFCDYLPSNSIYTWYTHMDPGHRTLGGIHKFGVTPGYNFTNGDGDQRTSRGIYRNTYSRSYGYIHPLAWNDWNVEPFPTSGTPLTGDNLRRKFYQHFNSDYGATEGDGAKELRAFIRHTIWHEKLIDAKPENWPELSVAVGRLLKNAHFVAVAKVNRRSPLTGEEIELSWCGLGSTLRGARMQRHQNTGWARWDNAASATIDPNLDTP